LQWKKSEVAESRPLVERAKCAPHAILSLCVRFQGKRQLQFVEERAKANASYYINDSLSKVAEDCHHLLGNNFVF